MGRGPSEDGFVRITGLTGLNNLVREDSLTIDPETGQAEARRLLNLDLDRRGKLRRRRGFTLAKAGTHSHSLWADPDFPFMLAVQGGQLLAFRPNQFDQPVVVRSGLPPLTPVSCALVAAGKVAFVSPNTTGLFHADGQTTALGVDTPGWPAAQAGPGGILPAGRYQIALTFAVAQGEEGGASLALELDVPENGAITLTGFPAPENPAVIWTRVYLSGPDGGVLHHAANVPVGLGQYILSQLPRGKPLETQFLHPMPPGQIARALNARLYVASGRQLWFSEAYQPGLRHAANSYRQFEARIDLLEPVGQAEGAGFYVGAGNRTYWMTAADPKQSSRVIAYPHGAVPGTGLTVPGSLFGAGETIAPVAYWLASNGVPCLGLPGGQVRPLTERTVVADDYARGASLLRERDGDRHLITTGLGGTTNAVAATDRLVMRHYRDGKLISP